MFIARTSPSIRRIVLAILCVLGLHGPGWTQNPPKAAPAVKRFDDASPLRKEPALKVKLTVKFKRPKAQDIIDRLRAVTKLDLVLADNIDRERPALDGLSGANVPAWVILEELAKSKIIQGKWERHGNGYRLTSPLPPVELAKTSPVDPRSPAGPARLGLYYFLYALPILALFAILLLIRRRRKRLHLTGTISS